jgi:YVTN family beta-propeller protein
VFVTSEQESKVYVIDTASLDVVKIVDVGPRPRSMTFLPDGSRAYVKVGEKPWGIALVPRRRKTPIALSTRQ